MKDLMTPKVPESSFVRSSAGGSLRIRWDPHNLPTNPGKTLVPKTGGATCPYPMMSEDGERFRGYVLDAEMYVYE